MFLGRPGGGPGRAPGRKKLRKNGKMKKMIEK